LNTSDTWASGKGPLKSRHRPGGFSLVLFLQRPPRKERLGRPGFLLPCRDDPPSALFRLFFTFPSVPPSIFRPPLDLVNIFPGRAFLFLQNRPLRRETFNFFPEEAPFHTPCVETGDLLPHTVSFLSTSLDGFWYGHFTSLLRVPTENWRKNFFSRGVKNQVCFSSQCPS